MTHPGSQPREKLMKQQHNKVDYLDMASLHQFVRIDDRKQFQRGVRRALLQVLENLQVEDHYDKIIQKIKGETIYRELNNTWERLEPEARAQKWQELMERIVQMAYAARPYCMRCGECCRQGSPSLHREDGDLLSRGFISTRQIYTLRKGELVSLNIQGRLGTLPGELIKIKEDRGSGHCIFYDEHHHACRIYQHRPLQCRMQKCWSPQALQELWRHEKLTRHNLLSGDQDLLDLMETHEQRCGPEKLDTAFKEIHQSGDVTDLDQVVEMLRQDMVFRTFLKNRLGREDGELDFLLGRPLTHLVRAYGFRVEEDADGTFHLLQDK
jgi:Fe-S-cluster containining protein